MTVETLLDRLQKVRSAGLNRWMACCPAHDDKTPSLAIKTEGDRILIHCFAGCGAADVVAAIGLSMTDLMPDRLGEHRAPWWANLRDPEPRNVREARNVLQFVQTDMATGKTISERSKREFLAALKTVRAFDSKRNQV